MNTMIMCGVKIGNGAVIAAGSIVTKDVKPYSTVRGIPAKFIKNRCSPEIIKQLNKIEWWNWSDEKISKNISDFYNINNFIKKHNIR